VKLLYFLNDPLTVGALALCVVLALIAVVVKTSTHWLSHIQRKEFLTPNEIHFFHRLQRALPAYHVFPQVLSSGLHPPAD
jgi:hypothetical protein